MLRRSLLDANTRDDGRITTLAFHRTAEKACDFIRCMFTRVAPILSIP
jgi:hypothetical protein